MQAHLSCKKISEFIIILWGSVPLGLLLGGNMNKLSRKKYSCNCGNTNEITTNHHNSFRCTECHNTLVCQTKEGIELHEKLKNEKLEWSKLTIKSVLNTDNHFITFKKKGIECNVSWNDNCHNNHNTFNITGTTFDEFGLWLSGGCIHDEITKAFPELAHLIKYHGWTTDGYGYKGANILYLAEKGDLESARKLAIWPNATLEELSNLDKLKERLPMLLKQLKKEVELLGFTY